MGGLVPPVVFDVACCHLVAEKMRQSVVVSVPECTDKYNCLSVNRSFFVEKFSSCTHISRECL